jgi:hypothetical protein
MDLMEPTRPLPGKTGELGAVPSIRVGARASIGLGERA